MKDERPIGRRDRQEAILHIVRSEKISSQMELRKLLAAGGIEVTQATLSRDLRDLRIVKVPKAKGGGCYTLPSDREHVPSLETLLPSLFVSADGTGNLLVLRTLTGGAQAVALGIDWEEWSEVLGTIAGDDTILVILREPEVLEDLRTRIMEIAQRS